MNNLKMLWSRALLGLASLCLLGAATFAADPDKTAVPTSQAFFERAVADSSGRQWKPIFNGKNLDGWKPVVRDQAPGDDPEKIFQVVDGAVHVYRDTPEGKKMPFGVILSDESYTDYRFRFEFKWGTKKFAPRQEQIRDAGLLFHVVGPEKIWPMSVECQVQEGDVGDNFLVYTIGDAPVDASGKKFQDASQGGTFKTFNVPGKVARVVKSETHEHDGWNTVEVIVRGDSAIYLANGKINNYIVNLRAPLGPDQKLVPLTAGRLALQCEGAELYYRKMELLNFQDQKSSQLEQSVPAKSRGTGVSQKNPVRSGSAAQFVPADESIAPIAPLSPREGLSAWKVREGFRVELMAAEPLLLDPVAIDWDLAGRLWVVEMADYPLGMDAKGASGGRIRVLEKSNPAGPYDRSHLFLEGLNFPTGIVAWKNGVIVTAAPDIFYAEDADGDGVCDSKTLLFSGFHEGNQQLRMNGLRWGLDGWLHCASGSHTPNYGKESRIRSHLTGREIALGSRDFRFHPETGELVPLSGPSQFGRNNDDWGNWFGVQNSYPLWHYVLEDRYLQRNPHLIAPNPRKLLTESNPRVFPVAEIGKQPNPHTRVGRFTSACSGMVYRDQLLPLGEGFAHAFTCEPVHNLIQQNVLHRDGTSFRMVRDVPGESPDFLASTDPWCRPVMVRTGPDGALWVVDMYRYVIEHPQWVPADAQKELAPYLRLGDGRGRLYRVLPESAPARAVPDILAASSTQLVELLCHPNGWVRDAAQQRLMTQKDPATLPALKALLKQIPASPGKLHAMFLIDSLQQGLHPDELARLLEDDSEEIRRHAVKLAEHSDLTSNALAAALMQRANDPSAAVRLQLACTLGEWAAPESVQTLAGMLTSTQNDSYIQAALFSSLNKSNIAAAVEKVAGLPLDQQPVREQYASLLAQAVAFGELTPIQKAMRHSADSADHSIRSMLCLAAVYQAPGNKAAAQGLDQAAIARIHTQARELLTAGNLPDWKLAACASLLFQRPQDAETDREFTRELLSQHLSSELSLALIRHLGKQRGLEYGQLILSGWSSYLPAARSLALEVWAARSEWHPLLLEAIDRGLVNPQEISLALQQQFVANRKSPSAKELQARFQSTRSTNLNPIAKRDVLKLEGNPTHGQEVFRKHCIDCHKFQGEGFSVGPNLGSITGRTSENLLDAILTPNQAIEPKYLSYVIAMEDGRTLSGIIESDTGNSLSLLKAKEEKTSVLRQEIEELRSTGKSLMPEGFDKTIPLQDLADLVKYLQQNDSAVSAVPAQ